MRGRKEEIGTVPVEQREEKYAPGRCSACGKKLTKIIRMGEGYARTVECGEAHTCLNPECSRSTDLTKVRGWMVAGNSHGK